MRIRAVAVTDGWAGRVEMPCEIVGETRTRYRVEFLKDEMLPARRHVRAGEQVLVPKHAVRKI